MSTDNTPEKSDETPAESAPEGEVARPLNRAERRAQGKKGQTAHPFLGGGASLPLGQRIHGGGPAANKSHFNRKVGGK
jgi:hypothetical protein